MAFKYTLADFFESFNPSIFFVVFDVFDQAFSDYLCLDPVFSKRFIFILFDSNCLIWGFFGIFSFLIEICYFFPIAVVIFRRKIWFLISEMNLSLNQHFKWISKFIRIPKLIVICSNCIFGFDSRQRNMNEKTFVNYDSVQNEFWFKSNLVSLNSQIVQYPQTYLQNTTNFLKGSL